MKLFFIFLVILLIFFIPIPIKINIYYSTINYYVKLYGFAIISKKKVNHKENNPSKSNPENKKNIKFLSNLHKDIDFKPLISFLYNSKFKPLFKIKFSLDYSLNDAAKTAIFYGVLCQIPSILYILLNVPFNIYKFNIKVNPIFEDRLLLKIETSSIIFISFANIIYITIILLKFIKKRGR